MDKKIQPKKAVQRTADVDTVRFSFNKLAGYLHLFYIYTYDNKSASRSVKTDVIGTVYGEKYIAQLVNRAIKAVRMMILQKLPLCKWFGVGTDVIGEEFIYTDALGALRKQFNKHEGAPDSVTVLPDFKKGNSFQFRTLYKPSPNAIDTFYSNYENRQVP